MKAALADKDFLNGTISLGALSRQYGIPKGTLSKHVNGKLKVGARRGQKPVLSKEEKDAIAEWLKNLASLGFG